MTGGGCQSQSLLLLTKPQREANQIHLSNAVTRQPNQFQFVPRRLCSVTSQTEPNVNAVSSPCSSPSSVFETMTMCPPGILGGLQFAGTMCASVFPVNNQLKELYSDIINVFKPISHFPAEIPAKCTLQQTLK